LHAAAHKIFQRRRHKKEEAAVAKRVRMNFSYNKKFKFNIFSAKARSAGGEASFGRCVTAHFRRAAACLTSTFELCPSLAFFMHHSTAAAAVHSTANSPPFTSQIIATSLPSLYGSISFVLTAEGRWRRP
jgi:hypothetical protein